MKVDALTAPQHPLDTTLHEAVREAVGHLIDSRQIRPDAFADPVYVGLLRRRRRGASRELAAALHAAFYGDREPLARAVRPAS
ncbi:hypothetical protein [Streptomyces exfoliatus]|uniref:hypothetical protein n=1 Tax=Streptomyces exfoliatus TaxID=1905 RepID=UPI0004CAF2F1|nr:hypothetical protein [Streptomyces exfoliatus]